MVPVLIDDWLYLDIDGHPGTYGREETERNLKPRIKSVTAAFIDCETRVIDTAHENNAQKEALINAAFSNEYLIQEERLPGQACQVIAASRHKIQDIYEYFKPVAVEALVPYAVGIRAFLKSQTLWVDDKIIVFVDDAKTQALVTILEGLRFTSTRRISMRDPKYMSTEIRRSQQNYLAQRDPRAQEAAFMVISNNREWLAAFMEQNIALRENMVHIDTAFPVLEGLKTAKFGMHFALPEDLVRKRKQALEGRRWKAAAAGILSIAVGTGLYAGALIYKNEADSRLARLRTRHQDNVTKLRELYPQKLKHLLSAAPAPRFDIVYYDFINRVPEGYEVKEFHMQNSDNRWQLDARILPADSYVPYQPFMTKGRSASAKVSGITLDKKLGQRIEWTIKPEGLI